MTAPRRLRVLHVVYSLDAGGMENGIINLAHQLRGEWDVEVACLDHSGRMAARMPDPRQVHVLGKPAGFSLRGVTQLAACVRQRQPDVLHTHNLGPLIYTTLAGLAHQAVPVLHGEHSQFAPEDLQPRRLLQRRLFFQRAGLIHTVSQGLSEELARHRLGGSRVRTIINGVDAEKYRPRDRGEARRALGIPDDAPVIGCVGRFGPFKRHDALIDAAEQLHAAGQALRLVLVGAGGPEETRIRERCRLSVLAERIHLTGFSATPEQVYPAFDLLAVPSVNEGLSNVMLEAMACGVPALSHGSCGSSEVITSGHDGLVADLVTAESLARELAGLMAIPERLARLGAAARETILGRFSLTRMAEGYATLYRELTDSRAPAH